MSRLRHDREGLGVIANGLALRSLLTKQGLLLLADYYLLAFGESA
jgi:hypothetical protein